MKSLMRLWLVVLALASFQLAHAQSTATVTRYALTFTHSAYNVSNQISSQAACAQAVSQFMAGLGGSWGGPVYGPANYTGTAQYAGWDYGSYAAGKSETAQAFCYLYVKPAGGAWSLYDSSSMTVTTGPGSLACPSAGDSRSVNMTLGYTHDPSADKSASVGTYADKYLSMRTAGSMCASGGGAACAVTFDASPPSMVWISASPNAQGLYRISVDQKVTYTGASCTQTANEKMVTESTDAAPACDGTYGVVNGKAVCVPSNSGSRNLVQSQTGTSSTSRQVGNPTAGSNGGLPIASRTPTGGTGSNDGGPVTPLDGSPAPLGSPLPTTPVSKSTVDLQLTGQCGGSGQPPCKIDETGTPTALPSDGQSVVNQAFDSLGNVVSTISNKADKDSSWGLVPFWLQSTANSCHPVTVLTLPPKLNSMTVTIDICPILPLIYTLMNLLWVVWTFGATVAMVFRVTSAGGA